MFRIGLTGGIGSGKSTIAKILEIKGYPVFYSDQEAKNIVHSDQNVQLQITNLLGKEAYSEGVYNREYVASKVFKDQNLLESLNKIIHPAVRKAFDHYVASKKEKLVFNEAAILFETGGHTTFDYNVLVCSPMELRLKRIMIRDKTSEKEVKARMSKQWSDDEKRKLADYVIENDEIKSILTQVDHIVRDLSSRLH